MSQIKDYVVVRGTAQEKNNKGRQAVLQTVRKADLQGRDDVNSTQQRCQHCDKGIMLRGF